jgi:putative membrane protein
MGPREMAEANALSSGRDRTFFIFNAVISAAAVGLIWFLLLRKGQSDAGLNLRFMPAVNATLNGCSAVLLTAGLVAIRKKRTDIHRHFMVAACVASALFLVGYLGYHYVHGDTKYVGDFRGPYLALLASHVLLSIAVVPMVFTALYFAWRKEFARHRKVTRFLIWMWLYVSVTGVLVFFMLRGSAPAA